MPIYMDRHNLPGVTAKDVAKAHQADLKIQDKYGCRGLTYWFDEVRGTAFCLVEAPDSNAVKEMHNHAHGLVPHHIIEVNSHIVEAFLGRIENPKIPDHSSNSDLFVFTDPAFRTIMAIALKKDSLMSTKKEVLNVIEQTNFYNKIIQETVKQFDGTVVEHKDQLFLISFVSVSQAVLSAQKIWMDLKDYNTITHTRLKIQIGLSAGVPVTNSHYFFGEAVQLAKRLSNAAYNEKIMVASVVKNLYQQEGLHFSTKDVPIQTVSPSEEEFLNQVTAVTDTQCEEPGFNIVVLARQIGVSKSQLYRKILSLTGLAPNDFIKEHRLNKAVQLIEKQQGNIAEIAYETGFSSPSYFSKCFQKKFGVLPSDYASVIA